MSVAEILLPLFIQIGLTFVLLCRMAWIRSGTLRRREVAARDIALRQPAWPARATQAANAFHNQLELPLLFYVLVILALMTRNADFLFVVLSWIFVVSRIVHALIHTTYNRVAHRGLTFAFGCVVLSVMWIVFILRIMWVY